MRRDFSITICYLLLPAFVALAVLAQEAHPLDASPWQLLVVGGKAELWFPADCHPLEYFSGSPLRFDYEQDFFQKNDGDLDLRSESTKLGKAGGRSIVQMIQQITERTKQYGAIPNTLKRLLVERRPAEYCAIYQQLYGTAQVTVRPASLIDVDGQPVLKTMDQNGNAAWNEEYWAFSKSGPIHLDLKAAMEKMAIVLPHGDTLTSEPVNWKGSCYSQTVWRSTGPCRACGLLDGWVTAKMKVNDGHLSVIHTAYSPDRRADPCLKARS